jgi:hypothetical protein
MIEQIERGWGYQWTPPRVSHPVGILSDDDAILSDLSVSELFRQRQAQIPGTVLIGRGVLPGSGGADHVVAVHGSFRLMPLVWHRSGGNGAVGGQSGSWHTGG